MIHIQFRLRWPFAKNNSWKSLYCWFTPVSKNKSFEIQFSQGGGSLVHCDLNIEWSGHDHAGPQFELEVFGYAVRMNLYDSRHWDYERDTWCDKEQ